MLIPPFVINSVGETVLFFGGFLVDNLAQLVCS